LLAAVAKVLGEPPPSVEESIGAPEPQWEIVGAIQAALNYAMAHLEWRCGLNTDPRPWTGVAEAFEDLRLQLRIPEDRDPNIASSSDPSDLLHSLVRPFLERLEACLPLPGTVD
jgi:hypothetical protein